MESTESEEDLLSELPSDILVSILEKLAVRDAVRVGVLSLAMAVSPHSAA
jgi:hypothetical protein